MQMLAMQVMGENATFKGGEDLLKCVGVDVENMRKLASEGGGSVRVSQG